MHCGEPRLTAVENAQIKWLDHSLYQREVFQSLYLVYFSALLFILSSLWSFLVSFRQHKHIISTFTQFKPFDHDQIILEVWSSKMSWSLTIGQGHVLMLWQEKVTRYHIKSLWTRICVTYSKLLGSWCRGSRSNRTVWPPTSTADSMSTTSPIFFLHFCSKLKYPAKTTVAAERRTRWTERNKHDKMTLKTSQLKF